MVHDQRGAQVFLAVSLASEPLAPDSFEVFPCHRLPWGRVVLPNGQFSFGDRHLRKPAAHQPPGSHRAADRHRGNHVDDSAVPTFMFSCVQSCVGVLACATLMGCTPAWSRTCCTFISTKQWRSPQHTRRSWTFFGPKENGSKRHQARANTGKFRTCPLWRELRAPRRLRSTGFANVV